MILLLFQEPEWVHVLSSDGSIQTPIGGIPGSSYLATKQFPEGGACAYLAVANGTKPKDWSNMSGEQYDFSQRSFQNEACPDTSQHMRGGAFKENIGTLVEAAIEAELHGDLPPRCIPVLERNYLYSSIRARYYF